MAKTKIGQIVSDKMTSTAIVSITRMVKHPLYHKRYHITKRIKADNPGNKYKLGDIVGIEECRPISKEKSWKIVKMIESKGVAGEIKDTEIEKLEEKSEEKSDVTLKQEKKTKETTSEEE